MNVIKRFELVVVVVAIGMTHNAFGAVNTYTDRATWRAANGSPAFSVDFESFLVDTSFATAPLDVGAFSLSTVGNPVTDLVDVSPFLFPPQPASFGNAHAEIYVEDSIPVAADLTLHNPVTGFFADFLYAGNTAPLMLTLSFVGGGTADLFVPGIGDDLEPFGFVSTAAVASIRFHNSVNDGFAIDNIEGGVVPEPGTAVQLILATASWCLRRRWFS
jgi:hypothetical protein